MEIGHQPEAQATLGANPRSNRAIEHLLAELNAAEMMCPGVTFKLVYTLIGVSSN